MSHAQFSPPGPLGSVPPDADAKTLFRLAQDDPSLWVQIAGHPNAYPDLLDWLESYGPAAVKEAVAGRRAGVAIPTVPVADAPPAEGAADLAPPSGVPMMSTPPAAKPADLAPPSGVPTMRTPPAAKPADLAPVPGAPVKSAPPVAGGAAFSPPPSLATQGVPGARIPDAPGLPTPFSSTPLVTRAERAAEIARREEGSPPESEQEETGAEVLDDKTRLGKRQPVATVLGTLNREGADPIDLVEANVIVGRRLNPADASTGEQYVVVTEPTKTISAKHARLSHHEGHWTICDLGSTNGIYLVTAQGKETRVEGEVEVKGDFYLGDVLFNLSVPESAGAGTWSSGDGV